jgi:SOS-response transcriptional repressor LexA
MRLSQQEKPQEKLQNKIPTVYLNAFELIEEDKIEKLKDIETPLVLVENVENFKENVFWLKIRDIWVLVGKIPPLKPEEGDIVFFKEKGKWGLFKFLKIEKEKIYLKDAKDERTTKVDKSIIEALDFYGKVLRVQEKV